MLKNFKELIVWQKAYQLCLDIYRATRGFPEDELYGLTSQMRRASVSVVSNIAEGYGRKTTADYLRSLFIAYGSVCELETQIMISTDLGHFSKQKEKCESLMDDLAEVERMLKSLIRSLQNKSLKR